SYLSTAHSDADLATVVRAFRDSVTEMRAAGFFGEPVGQIFNLPPERQIENLPHKDTNGHAGYNGKPHDEPLPFPLTEAHHAIWLAAQLGPEASCAFNESCALRLRGPFDLASLRPAIP